MKHQKCSFPRRRRFLFALCANSNWFSRPQWQALLKFVCLASKWHSYSSECPSNGHESSVKWWWWCDDNYRVEGWHKCGWWTWLEEIRKWGEGVERWSGEVQKDSERWKGGGDHQRGEQTATIAARQAVSIECTSLGEFYVDFWSVRWMRYQWKVWSVRGIGKSRVVA